MSYLYKTICLLIALSCACLRVSAQTTLTEDANGNLNTARIVAATPEGQSFFIGHQIGAGYGNTLAIFSALTDNPNGAYNYFYDGITNGNRNFFVRADGQGYFAANVGIGTAATNSMLTLNSSSGGDLLLQTNGTSIARLSADATSSTWNGGGAISLNLVATAADINFQTGNTAATKMVIKNNGNVLIGQTTQVNTNYMLDVKGNVRSNAVVVNTSGADFVFRKNYRLPSLAAVALYISLNHHLPGIASAQEMQHNGLDLGENQVKLLKKIEELTLYLLDKDKQISKQQQQLDEQAQRIDKLEAALEKLTTNK